MMVCSGDAVGWCGAIVAWSDYQENFIGLMVNIDGGDNSLSCWRPILMLPDPTASRAGTLPWRVRVVCRVEHWLACGFDRLPQAHEASSCLRYLAKGNRALRLWRSP